jgi:hypothetical protein
MPPESSEGNHRDVNDEKEQKKSGDEEMQGPRRLATSEEVDGGGYGGVKGG